MTPIHTACAFWQWVKRLFVRSRHPATTNPTLKDSPMTLPTEILDDLAKRFRHVVTTAEDVIASHSTVATIIEDAAKSLIESIPAGREAALVLTKLEEAASWAHAAVARNPVSVVTPVDPAQVVPGPEAPLDAVGGAAPVAPLVPDGANVNADLSAPADASAVALVDSTAVPSDATPVVLDPSLQANPPFACALP